VSRNGRVALVTGGSRGIGKAIVRRLLEGGTTVAFCARSAPDLRAVAQELGSIGPDLLPIQADVTREGDIEKLVRGILDRFSRIDILVNNAGVYGPIGPAWDVDPNEWRDAVTTNLVGAFLMCRAVVPILIRQRGGKIINMSGGGAATPFARYTAYAVSKAALVRFTETLALEVADHNVQVNAIAPGFVATTLHQRTLEAGERAGAEFLRKTKEELERGGLDAAIPAALVAFLASPAADRITGKFISSVWDDWQNFEQHLDEIAKGDVYTLRRIVPRDRGMDWK
jgi:NAD(P)-dependent dehydrogenase (short-subunit alcohol dehydrogenase family)